MQGPEFDSIILHSRVLGHHMVSADFLNLTMATQGSNPPLRLGHHRPHFCSHRQEILLHLPTPTDRSGGGSLFVLQIFRKFVRSNQLVPIPLLPKLTTGTWVCRLSSRKNNLSWAHEKPWHWRGTERANNKLQMKRDLSRAATTQRKIMFWSSWPFWALTSWLITKNLKDCSKWLTQLF